jgi:hypothetical protein
MNKYILLLSLEGRIVSQYQAAMHDETVADLIARNVRFTVYEAESIPTNIHTHWFWNEASQGLAPLPELPIEVSKLEIAADGEDEAIVSGIPEGVKIVIDGTEYETPDGEIVITSTVPATYVLRVKHPSYLPWSAEIVAQ